jgi:hypothetical protein
MVLGYSYNGADWGQRKYDVEPTVGIPVAEILFTVYSSVAVMIWVVLILPFGRDNKVVIVVHNASLDNK